LPPSPFIDITDFRQISFDDLIAFLSPSSIFSWRYAADEDFFRLYFHFIIIDAARPP
jgi:hypothetical protein